MKAVVLEDASGPENLNIVERPDPVAGPGEVLVRMKAASLNYRDLLMTRGGYGSRQKKADLIPLSDGAGEVIALGEGGSDTLRQSLWAIRPGGIICLIGVLSGARADLLIPLIGSRNVNLQGVSVGTREGLEDMMRGMAANGVKPVIDSVYPLQDARAAFEHLPSGGHFGKVCISL